MPQVYLLLVGSQGVFIACKWSKCITKQRTDSSISAGVSPRVGRLATLRLNTMGITPETVKVLLPKIILLEF